MVVAKYYKLEAAGQEIGSQCLSDDFRAYSSRISQGDQDARHGSSIDWPTASAKPRIRSNMQPSNTTAR